MKITTALPRWVLATNDGKFVSIDARGKLVLTPDFKAAMVYDYRDNEKTKPAIIGKMLNASLTVVTID